MIFTYLLKFLVDVLSFIFGFIPTATIASLPIIGSTIASILTSVVLIWNAFMVTFPYAQDLWNVFLYVIIPFEIAVIVLRFFLGNRSPIH